MCVCVRACVCVCGVRVCVWGPLEDYRSPAEELRHSSTPQRAKAGWRMVPSVCPVLLSTKPGAAKCPLTYMPSVSCGRARLHCCTVRSHCVAEKSAPSAQCPLPFLPVDHNMLPPMRPCPCILLLWCGLVSSGPPWSGAVLGARAGFESTPRGRGFSRRGGVEGRRLFGGRGGVEGRRFFGGGRRGFEGGRFFGGGEFLRGEVVRRRGRI